VFFGEGVLKVTSALEEYYSTLVQVVMNLPSSSRSASNEYVLGTPS
jgi:hypothetical protein